MKVAKATFTRLEWGWIVGDISMVMEEMRRRPFLKGRQEEDRAHNVLLMSQLAGIHNRIVRRAALEGEYMTPRERHLQKLTLTLTLADCAAITLLYYSIGDQLERLMRIATDALLRN